MVVHRRVSRYAHRAWYKDCCDTGESRPSQSSTATSAWKARRWKPVRRRAPERIRESVSSVDGSMTRDLAGDEVVKGRS